MNFRLGLILKEKSATSNAIFQTCQKWGNSPECFISCTVVWGALQAKKNREGEEGRLWAAFVSSLLAARCFCRREKVMSDDVWGHLFCLGVPFHVRWRAWIVVDRMREEWSFVQKATPAMCSWTSMAARTGASVSCPCVWACEMIWLTTFGEAGSVCGQGAVFVQELAIGCAQLHEECSHVRSVPAREQEIIGGYCGRAYKPEE